MENNLDKMLKMAAYDSRKYNKSTAWLLFLLFGWHYGSIGKLGVQLLYYITLGGFGLWALILLFYINENVDRYNLSIAKDIGIDKDTLMLLNLK